MKFLTISMVCTSILGLSGCQPAPEPGGEIFASYCAGCHGRKGAGNGPYASKLPIAPADLTGLSARNGGRFPMADVIAKIHGYPDPYHAEIMPEFGTLLSGKTVTVSGDEGQQVEAPKAIVDLALYLRSIQAD